MKRQRNAYTLITKLAAIFMVVTLVWLTISLPFVNGAKEQKTAVTSRPDHRSGDSGNSSNPFGNTTEEKNPNSTSFAEEFLHEHHQDLERPVSDLDHGNCTHSPLCVAFHGELLSPPPEA